MTPHFSTEERWAIVILHKFAGWSNFRIPDALHFASSMIGDTIKRDTESGDVIDTERSGRPPLLQFGDSEYKSALTVVNRHRPFRAVSPWAKDWRDHHRIEVSESSMLCA